MRLHDAADIAYGYVVRKDIAARPLKSILRLWRPPAPRTRDEATDPPGGGAHSHNVGGYQLPVIRPHLGLFTPILHRMTPFYLQS